MPLREPASWIGAVAIEACLALGLVGAEVPASAAPLVGVIAAGEACNGFTTLNGVDSGMVGRNCLPFDVKEDLANPKPGSASASTSSDQTLGAFSYGHSSAASFGRFSASSYFRGTSDGTQPALPGSPSLVLGMAIFEDEWTISAPGKTSADTGWMSMTYHIRGMTQLRSSGSAVPYLEVAAALGPASDILSFTALPVNGVIDQMVTVEGRFAFNQAFPYAGALAAVVGLQCTGAGTYCDAFGIDARAQFEADFSFDSLKFYDENRDPIEVAFSTASSATSADPPMAVPEPAIPLLLVTGLVALWLARPPWCPQRVGHALPRDE